MTKIRINKDELKSLLAEQAQKANELYNKYQGLESHEYTYLKADAITRELNSFDNYTKELLKQSFTGSIENNEYLKEFSQIIHMNDNLKWIPLDNNPNYFAADVISKEVILRNMHEFLIDLVAKLHLIDEETRVQVEEEEKSEINILIISSNPEDQDQLNYGKEHREIRDRIRKSPESYRINIHDRTAVRAEDIITAINETNPDFIHISGHGDDKSLAIQGGNGETVDLTEKMLKAVIESSENEIKIIVLSACHSHQIAEGLSKTVPVVIGMNDAIGDDDAVVFASQFYSSLAFGKSVSTAFEQGKAAVLIEGLEDNDVPELYIKGDIDPLSYKPIKSGS